MRVTHIDTLKQAVEQKFSRRILTSTDAIELGERIYKRTGRQISPNTLRRVFGLVRSNYLPSFSTMDTLSLYCGYASFDAFIKTKVVEVPEASAGNTALLQYIEHLFQNVNVKDTYDTTYIDVVTHTISYLKETPDIIRLLQSNISKTKNGQDFYFERLVNTDKLAAYYGDGLPHYIDAKNTKEAQIFGHSLLCFKGWLTMDDRSFEKHFKETVKHNIDPKANPFVSSRYFAIQFLYADATGSGKDNLIADVRRFYEKTKPAKNAHYKFPCFEFIIACSLTMVKEYDEALYYAKAGLQRKEGIEVSENEKGLYCFFELYIAIALFNKGEKEKAKELLKKLQPSSFHLLSRQFHTILLLQLKSKFQRNKKDREQILHLVNETGFKRLLAREAKAHFATEQK